MIETLIAISKSEFFWGIVIGAVLTWIGSILIVRLQERSQRKLWFERFRAFSIDTVSNLAQMIRDLHNLRQRTNAIQMDVLTLLEVEIAVFGRNREHIISLPPEVRRRLREFVNNVGIRRGIIANYLNEFYRQTALADQLDAQGQGPHAQRVRAAAATGPLQNANAAEVQLHDLLADSDRLLQDLQSAQFQNY